MSKKHLTKNFKLKMLSVSLFLIIILSIFPLLNAADENTPTNEGCIPNWKCSKFIPDKCPIEGVRTRGCIDLNNCGTDEGKPALTQTCEKKSILFYITISILSLAAIYLLIIVLKRIFKKREKLNERQTAKDKYYKEGPEYPSETEQYYSSDQTYNLKPKSKSKKNNQYEEEEDQEKFSEKYWPK